MMRGLLVPSIMAVTAVAGLAHHGGPHHPFEDSFAPSSRAGRDFNAAAASYSQQQKPVYPYQQPQPQQQQQQANPSAQPRAASTASALWPSSANHWEGIPTTLGASSDWTKWGSAAPAQDAVLRAVNGAGGSSGASSYLSDDDGRSAFEFGDDDGEDRPFKRHVHQSDFSSANSFAPPPPPPPRHTSSQQSGFSFDDDDDDEAAFKLPSDFRDGRSPPRARIPSSFAPSSSSIYGGGEDDDGSSSGFNSPFQPPPSYQPPFETSSGSQRGGREPASRPVSSDADAFAGFGGRFRGAPDGPSFPAAGQNSDDDEFEGFNSAGFPGGQAGFVFGQKESPVGEERRPVEHHGFSSVPNFRESAPAPTTPTYKEPSDASGFDPKGFSGFGHDFPSKFEPSKNFGPPPPSSVEVSRPVSPSQSTYRSPQPVPHGYTGGERDEQSQEYRRPQRETSDFYSDSGEASSFPSAFSPPSYENSVNAFEPAKSTVPVYTPPSKPTSYRRRPSSPAPYRPTRPVPAHTRQRHQQQQRRPYPQVSQTSASEYDRVKAAGDDILDSHFREFQTNFENSDRGVDSDETYSDSDGGRDKYEYVQANYRQPIQRVYNRKPEHSEEGYGSDFGAVQAYKGGFSSEKFDPKEFAKLDAMVRPPREDEEAVEGYRMLDEEVEGTEEEPVYGQRGAMADEGAERYRDPDEDEEGYYVPREARLGEEEESEEEESDGGEEVDVGGGDGEPQHRGRHPGVNDIEIQKTRAENNWRKQRGFRYPHRLHQQQQQERQPAPMYRSRREEDLAKMLAAKYASSSPHGGSQQHHLRPQPHWRHRG